MIDRSTQKMLLIDHFRFNETGLEQICGLSDLDVVVSDRKPDTVLMKELNVNGVTFHGT
jgi:DeoR/GlpR family transcriptional regulator of sugar metabolism